MRRRWAGTLATLVVAGTVTAGPSVATAAPARGVALRHATPTDSLALARADSAYAKQDWVQAARGYAAFTHKFAAGGRTWYRLASSEGAMQRWPGAIAAYRTADAMGVPPQFAAYNMACAFARAGAIDSAYAVLGRAADRGWGAVESLDADADLAPVRSDARFAALRERADRNQHPCRYRPESRGFDFWIGDWEVHDNQRGHGIAGRSHVEKIVGDCVIFENWTGAGGGSGKSFNSYNVETGAWQQNWMDESGDVSNFEGGHVDGGKLSFVAHKVDAQGRPFLSRLTFFDLGPNEVRQFGEQSNDDGKTWSVRYDFDYLRVK
jgi:hypothetical protein